MMKTFFTMVIAAFFAITAQAGNPVDGTFKVKADQSVITWKAEKVTGKHHGKISIKEGSLQFEKDVFKGGSFIIDMPSIVVEDLQGQGKSNLEGHLKSDDFFGVETFPTATLVVKNAVAKGNGNYDVTGDLTIKGKTHPITFPATITHDGKTATAKAEIKIDRSLYDVKYGSGKFFDNLGDKTIYDEFELSVSLVAAQ